MVCAGGGASRPVSGGRPTLPTRGLGFGTGHLLAVWPEVGLLTSRERVRGDVASSVCEDTGGGCAVGWVQWDRGRICRLVSSLSPKSQGGQ